jgi:hypothetical protein
MDPTAKPSPVPRYGPSSDEAFLGTAIDVANHMDLRLESVEAIQNMTFVDISSNMSARFRAWKNELPSEPPELGDIATPKKSLYERGVLNRVEDETKKADLVDDAEEDVEGESTVDPDYDLFVPDSPEGDDEDDIDEEESDEDE